jgi:hypothetical protein
MNLVVLCIVEQIGSLRLNLLETPANLGLS